MLLMFEEGIRGGMCQAIIKYACANNKYLKNCNKKILSSYLMYLDANNLYGQAMIKGLPVGKFEWIHPKDFRRDAIKSSDDNEPYLKQTQSIEKNY